jgi:hypothetical protein
MSHDFESVGAASDGEGKSVDINLVLGLSLGLGGIALVAVIAAVVVKHRRAAKRNERNINAAGLSQRSDMSIVVVPEPTFGDPSVPMKI